MEACGSREKAMSKARVNRTVDWSRWLHDPGHWERFYDELGVKTYAAIASALCTGQRVESAVDTAVEDISRQMREDGLPEAVVLSYREEYLKHHGQLIEVATEICDVLPGSLCQATAAGAPGAHDGPAAAEAIDPLMGAMSVFVTSLKSIQHEAEEWSHLFTHHPEHRHSAAGHDQRGPEDALLTGHYGRRSHDVDVERL